MSRSADAGRTLPRLLLEAVLVTAVLASTAHAIERPKLPRGFSCRACSLSTAARQPLLTVRAGREGGSLGGREVVSAASDASPLEGLLVRLSPRQGRSPYWPLRHPALENARKRQRTMEAFQPPQVRFYSSFADFGAGGGGGGGGPYLDVDDSAPSREALDEPNAIVDNRIKDRTLTKAMTAEDLIRALQEKSLRQQEEDGLAGGAIRFGGMLGRK